MTACALRARASPACAPVSLVLVFWGFRVYGLGCTPVSPVSGVWGSCALDLVRRAPARLQGVCLCASLAPGVRALVLEPQGIKQIAGSPVPKAAGVPDAQQARSCSIRVCCLAVA